MEPMKMNVFAVASVLAPAEKKQEDREQRDRRRPKDVDLKVQDLVSHRGRLPRVIESSLFATTVDPTEQMIPHKEKRVD